MVVDKKRPRVGIRGYTTREKYMKDLADTKAKQGDYLNRLCFKHSKLAQQKQDVNLWVLLIETIEFGAWGLLIGFICMKIWGG